MTSDILSKDVVEEWGLESLPEDKRVEIKQVSDGGGGGDGVKDKEAQ